MGLLRRHPPGPELGAWFDGEQAGDVGSHVAHCARCRRRVSEMARVRAWIRAQPFFAMGDEPERAAPLRRWRPLAVTAAVLVGMLLLVPNTAMVDRSADESRQRNGGAAPPLLSSGAEGQARALQGPGETAPVGADAGARPPPPRPGPVPSPLRLGLVVPTTGSSAREGAEVRQTVRRRVDQANASGGVGGLPVELVVVAAEDEAGVSSLPTRVTALVGGFGGVAPPDVPWLFPAEPTVSGPNVVPAEASPHEVGQHTGEVLRRQLLVGPVGVVVGAGPEGAMGAGLASKVPTTTVAASTDSSCAAEVASLRRAGAVALAVAGPGELAARCLMSAARAGWRPPYGTLVAPSAAYARLEAVPEAHGARTLLALPWPTAPGPGAARFRASSSSRSYRALVSFAATELAIDVARQHGTISPATLNKSSWRSDLFQLDGGGARATPVVVGPRGWLPASEEIRIGPLPIPPLPLPVPSLPLP